MFSHKNCRYWSEQLGSGSQSFCCCRCRQELAVIVHHATIRTSYVVSLWDEVGTSVVCRPLNLQGRACVTAAAAALLCYTTNKCCATQPTKCCAAQPTKGNFTAFSAAAFISLTKNCWCHEVDAAWEPEQSRFTISIGIDASSYPEALWLTEF